MNYSQFTDEESVAQDAVPYSHQITSGRKAWLDMEEKRAVFNDASSLIS